MTHLSHVAAEMSDVHEEEGGHREDVWTRYELEDAQEYVPTRNTHGTRG